MRGRGEVSIYRRGDGYWVDQVEAGHYPNGRRRRARVVRRRRTDVFAEHIGNVRLAKLRVTHVQTMVNELSREGLARRGS